MRLAKYLARAGVASRRRAEDMIYAGRVAVNGVTADKPQVQVSAGDTVTVDGKAVQGPERKIYLLLNKPPGYISTAHDTHNRPTVTDLLGNIEARVYPVGRLDADTCGALMLTNDGELAHRLMHPRYEVEKVYHALVKGLPGESALEMMRRGIVIEGEKTAPAGVKLLKAIPQNNTALLEITLTEGKKRQVKKMCSAAGHPVRALKRVSFAGLKVNSLKQGAYRELEEQEISSLYRLAGLEG